MPSAPGHGTTDVRTISSCLRWMRSSGSNDIELAPQNPVDPFRAWDASLTFDFLPTQFSTFRFEHHHRAASVPYFSGPGGIPPPGGNTGPSTLLVEGFAPDLRKFERKFTIGSVFKLRPWRGKSSWT